MEHKRRHPPTPKLLVLSRGAKRSAPLNSLSSLLLSTPNVDHHDGPLPTLKSLSISHLIPTILNMTEAEEGMQQTTAYSDDSDVEFPGPLPASLLKTILPLVADRITAPSLRRLLEDQSSLINNNCQIVNDIWIRLCGEVVKGGSAHSPARLHAEPYSLYHRRLEGWMNERLQRVATRLREDYVHHSPSKSTITTAQNVGNRRNVKIIGVNRKVGGEMDPFATVRSTSRIMKQSKVEVIAAAGREVDRFKAVGVVKKVNKSANEGNIVFGKLIPPRTRR